MQIKSSILAWPSGRVLRSFHSKKNTVSLVSCREAGEDRLLILKEHKTAEKAAAEYETLAKLSEAGLAVPSPLGLAGNLLFLEFLEGLLLLDILEHNLVPRSVWTEALARWYRQLHTVTSLGDGNVLLKEDNNLRNFIFREGVFYGIDFETSSRGNPARDLGQLCAFILANRPAFTASRLAEASLVSRQYLTMDNNLSINLVETELILELERMARRRQDTSDSIKAYIAYLMINKNFL